MSPTLFLFVQNDSTIPNEFEKLAPINIGFTAGIETSKVAPVWLQKGNEMDKILVVSEHAKQTYELTTARAQNESTGEVVPYSLKTPIEVTHEYTERSEPEPISELVLDYDFNFLMISQLGPRKNFANAVKWWVEEFFDQEVGLVVKTNFRNNSIIDYEHTQATFQNLLSEYSDRKCKVYLLHGDLTSGQMTGLYNNDKIKALINIAHGEGFGLPMFEAAREGLPIVAVGWSGHLDFLVHDGKEYYQKVKYSIKPVQREAVWEGVVRKDSMWAFANQGSYKMVLRKTLKKWDTAEKTAKELQKIINRDFSPEALHKKFIECLDITQQEESDIVVL